QLVFAETWAGRFDIADDQRTLAIVPGNRRSPMTVVDLEDASSRRTIDIGFGAADLAIDPGGRWAALGFWNAGGRSAEIWDLSSGRQLHTLPIEGNTRVAFSPDGKWLATSTFDADFLWEAGSWRLLRRFPADVRPQPGSPRFAPDGRQLAVIT